MHDGKLGDRRSFQLRIFFVAGDGHDGRGVSLQKVGVQHLFLDSAVGIFRVNGLQRLGGVIGMDEAEVANGGAAQLRIFFALRGFEKLGRVARKKKRL